MPDTNGSIAHSDGMRAGFHMSPFLSPSRVPSCTGPLCAAPGSLIALTMPVAAADQTSGTLDAMGWCAFNLSARGLNHSETLDEQARWHAALDFHNRTGMLDLSYDGFWYKNDLHAVHEAVEQVGQALEIMKIVNCLEYNWVVLISIDYHW